ncbi:MAG: PTS fructose transporter subunit IIA [Gammaproteobacteria bacterium HGW-Gammaproteobacteria-1]|nr:MAG: PTS fructose transporter subunit IIA [Gammaproteobacteria bacterium HGW-Gammaproteobacteria-1]
MSTDAKVGILLVTHDPLGKVLLSTADAILGHCPLPVEVLTVPLDADPELTAAEARRMATKLDRGAGVLVLTDLYGSTPGNIACSLLEWEQVRVVSGLNLPMLLRVCNYHALDLEHLTEKAASGGRDAILVCAGRNIQSANERK